MSSGGHASGSAVVVTTISFTVLAGVLCIARIYTRLRIMRNAGIDDALIAFGLLLTSILTGTLCEQVRHGMGRHSATLVDHEKIHLLIWFWVSVWIYYLALWSVKLSILFQYLRILPSSGFRIACYVLMSVVTVWTLWAFFSAIFACTPVKHFWDDTIEGTCLNRLVVWFANAAVNIATDICTAILPLPVLNTLRIPRRQKYTLMFVFGLGGMSCLLSILRLHSLYVISKSTDVSWDNPLAAIYSSMEVNIGILCSCLPTLRGLLARFFPSLCFEDGTGSRSSHQRSPAVQRFHAHFSVRNRPYKPDDQEHSTHVLTAHYESPVERPKASFVRTVHFDADDFDGSPPVSPLSPISGIQLASIAEDLGERGRHPTYSPGSYNSTHSRTWTDQYLF